MSVIRRSDVVRRVRRGLDDGSPLCGVAEFESPVITRTQSRQTARSIPVVAILPPDAKSMRRTMAGHDTERFAGSSLGAFRKRAREIA